MLKVCHLFLVALLLLTLPAVAQESVSINLHDENIFLTPENWVPSVQALETSNPGAYFKMGFTGTSLRMTVDTLGLRQDNPDREQPYAELPKIGIQIDDGPINSKIVPSIAAAVTMTLAENLAPGNHQVRISLEGLGRDDRWYYPNDELRITSLSLDAGAHTLPPQLRKHRMVVYGDSISEGADILGEENRVRNKQWSLTWESRVADVLNAEVSVIAYQGQGFRARGEGFVPKFTSAYRYVRNGILRQFSKPDYVFVMHGTNGTTEYDDVSSMMMNLRRAYPKAKLVFGVPFDRSAEGEISSEYQDMKKIDRNLVMFKLKRVGSKILEKNSYDGRHPDAEGQRLLGDLILSYVIDSLYDIAP